MHKKYYFYNIIPHSLFFVIIKITCTMYRIVITFIIQAKICEFYISACLFMVFILCSAVINSRRSLLVAYCLLLITHIKILFNRSSIKASFIIKLLSVINLLMDIITFLSYWIFVYTLYKKYFINQA